LGGVGGEVSDLPITTGRRLRTVVGKSLTCAGVAGVTSTRQTTLVFASSPKSTPIGAPE
jgi:hypothetical protein